MKQKPAFVTQFLGVKIGYISIHSLCCLYCLLIAKHHGIVYAVVFDEHVHYSNVATRPRFRVFGACLKKTPQNNHHLL